MANPNPRVYFTDKQIKKRHFNKETGRYEGYAHSKAKNKDGTPVQMVHVLLPSADNRQKQFGIDKNGIDRDLREAYIQVPLESIKDTKEKRRKVLYLNKPDSMFTVYFKGQRIMEGPRTGLFDNPEKVRISVKEMQEIYPTKLVSKIKKQEKNKEPQSIKEPSLEPEKVKHPEHKRSRSSDLERG